MTNGQQEAVTLSQAPIPLETGWQRHIVDPGGAYALPVGVEIDGDASQVEHPEALLREGGDVTTIVNTESGSSTVIVDFGTIVSGFVEVGVRKVEGAALRVVESEWREHCGPRGDAEASDYPIFPDGYSMGTSDDPDGRWDIHEPTSSPIVLRSPAVRGSQRYVILLLEGAGQAEIDFVRVEKTNYQPTHDGHFLCSDDFLTKAWYVDAYSLGISTAREVHGDESLPWMILDGGKRDRYVFSVDLLTPARAAYYLSHDYRPIARDSLNVFACNQKPDGLFPLAAQLNWRCELGGPYEPAEPPAWYTLGQVMGQELMGGRCEVFTLWWVPEFAEYYRYTGDETFVRPAMDVARRVIDFFLANPTEIEGLYETGRTMVHGDFNWHPPDTAAGVDAQSNAVFYAALRGMAYLERELNGDAAKAAEYEDRAEVVREALLASHWDDEVGAMILNVSDPNRAHTVDAQAGPLLWGMLDEERAERAMRFLATELASPYGTVTGDVDSEYMDRFISPNMIVQEMLGRFRYGKGTEALELGRKAWKHMYEHGPGTAWESFALDGTPGAAHTCANHGWSTLIPVLSGWVLGVDPVGPGYRTWRIAPQPADLQWAQGEVPTPHGMFSVAWQRGNGDRSFVLSIDAAHGTGEVAIPLLGDTSRVVAMDGNVVWDAGKAADDVDARIERDALVIEGVGTGAHTFAWASSEVGAAAGATRPGARPGPAGPRPSAS